MNLPKVFLSKAYFVASSSALCASPVAPAATWKTSRDGLYNTMKNVNHNNCKRTLTGGLVLSNAPMAILKPAPSPIKTFSFGILTSSNVMPLVSEHLWPMFNSCWTKECRHKQIVQNLIMKLIKCISIVWVHQTAVVSSLYLSARLDSWGVSFNNKACESLASRAFGIGICAGQQEVPINANRRIYNRSKTQLWVTE